MIPAMAMLFARKDWSDQHLQAAAMLVNVAVAVPAARKHYKMGAFRADLFRAMLPPRCSSSSLASSCPTSSTRGAAAVRDFSGLRLSDKRGQGPAQRQPHEPDNERVTRLRGLCWSGYGLPLRPAWHRRRRHRRAARPRRLQARLKNCIAVASMVMCLTAGVGAALKVALLPGHGHSIVEPFVLFLCLAPPPSSGR